MAELLSNYTDIIIKDVDRKIGAKYKMSLRDFLSDPSKYSTQANVQVTISNMKEDVNDYINERLKSLDAEQKEVEDTASRADSITSQLMQIISAQAKQNHVVVIKPVSIDRDTTQDLHIFIDSIDNDSAYLIEKLVGSSTFVADFSFNYKEYKIGEWLFSGNKTYLLTVYMPENNVTSLESSRTELQDLFDSAGDFIRGL